MRLALCLLALAAPLFAASFEVEPSPRNEVWVGSSLWANRLQDWHWREGWLECRAERPLPLRTVHLLTAELATPSEGEDHFETSVTCQLTASGRPADEARAGFLLGVGPTMDWRGRTVVHGWPGPGSGILASVDARGRVSFVDLERPGARITSAATRRGALPRDGMSVLHVDSVEPESRAAHVLDGDLSTFWHTEWREHKPVHPHEIVLDLGELRATGGLVYVPRQDSVSGRIADYEIYLHTLPPGEHGDWGNPVAKGRFPNSAEEQRVQWPTTVARFLRLVALGGHNDRPPTTVAELFPLGAGDDGEETRPSGDVVGPIELRVRAERVDTGQHRLTLEAVDGAGALTDTAELLVESDRLRGGMALVSHPGRTQGQTAHWRFRDWRGAGTRLHTLPHRALGSILSAHYTVSRGQLKLAAQLFPLSEGAHEKPVTLQLEREGEWQTAGSERPDPTGHVAVWNVRGWDAGQEVRYRLLHDLGEGEVYSYEGTIARDPAHDGEELVLAGLSCNHNNSHSLGARGQPTNWPRWMWFPHADLVERVRSHEPDLYFFPGDQIYEGRSPTFADRENLAEDYLYKWFLWCWAYRDLTRHKPCVVIPDDHDVYQGNLWGEGGRPAQRDNEGGYVHPAWFVNMVQRTQTSHLPDPIDRPPVEQDIGVYFTHLVWGRVSFAILEDRKFKSGCARPEMPESKTRRPDHWNDPEFDTSELDLPGLELLGSRQEAFLRAWSADWAGADLKCVLSQTVFANLATHHGAGLDELIADLDSNGWPQSGRRRALEELRRGFALHVAGDQHLATLAQHGLDAHEDCGWSFCLPATANFYPRMWNPPREGTHRGEGAPAWQGRHLDGFGNRVTIHAAANPGLKTGRFPPELHDKMPGYGIVRFDPRARTYTLECWPRGADPANDDQYEGWPRTVSQREQYGREPTAWLPELDLRALVDAGFEQPVVQLYHGDELVYALRLPAGITSFQPWAYATGTHTLSIGDPDRKAASSRLQWTRLRDVEATTGGNRSVLVVAAPGE